VYQVYQEQSQLYMAVWYVWLELSDFTSFQHCLDPNFQQWLYPSRYVMIAVSYQAREEHENKADPEKKRDC
jgi:hypothetical protein